MLELSAESMINVSTVNEVSPCICEEILRQDSTFGGVELIVATVGDKTDE